MSAQPAIHEIKDYLLTLQKNICQTLADIDGSKQFNEDSWERPAGGNGLSCVLEEGDVIERGGVNFSHVYGKDLPSSAMANRPELAGRDFQALGLSLVIHPRNPYAPTSHMNVRLFIATKANEDPIWWFGGGFDLTPYYGFEEDCIHWHKIAKSTCDPFGNDVYQNYKKWCDDYFYLKHRNEPRGIGGIFFDDLNQWDFKTCFNFIKDVGNAYLEAYAPILKKRKDTPYSETERQFQLYRRGRYVEFNLIYDRGTLFGLQSGGRTESILISLPASVSWRFNWHPEPDSKEAELYNNYLVAKNWLTSQP